VAGLRWIDQIIMRFVCANAPCFLSRFTHMSSDFIHGVDAI